MRSSVKALAILVVTLVVTLGSAPASADVLKVGDRMVEIEGAVNALGKPFKLKSLKGRWLFVTIGAAWCVPCKKELPVWDKLAGELKNKIFFIALDADEKVEDGKKFHKKLKIAHMMSVFVPPAAAARYVAATMPSSFVIDPQGVVRYVHAGFDERDTSGEYKKMKAQLLKLVK